MTTTTDNEKRRKEIVNKLLPKAVPGNAAWQRIVNLTGYDGDYTPADHGMHWSDNN